MAARNVTLSSQANGLPKTSPPAPEPEAPGICRLKEELSEMLRSKISDSYDAFSLCDIAASGEPINIAPMPMSSSSSSVTAQNETDGENPPGEQYKEEQYRYKDDQHEVGEYEHEAHSGKQGNEVEELYYVSNAVREYHSLLLQASDALSVDVNACREHCYHLLASVHVPKGIRCGALYLLAELSNTDGRRQEAKGFLEQALILCDEMDRVNEEQGVAIGMVPRERVQALRNQLGSISEAIRCARVVVVSKHTTPSSSRGSSQPHTNIENCVRVMGSHVTIEDQNMGETVSSGSNTSYMMAQQEQSQSKDRENGVPKTRIDRCHITELEFALTRTREEEGRAKGRLQQVKKKREMIEERLVKMRKLWELQKV
ncbi:hypothetical protein E2P81_ATG04619 [Venturia nashicola]|nr:hypothetical protein E2P81_ATG04619 [Venturia nashicola]